MIPIVRWLEIIFLREEIDFKKPWVFLRLMRNLTSQSCRRPSNCLVWNPEIVKRLVYLPKGKTCFLNSDLMLFLPLLGFPGGSAGKESSCTVRDLALISGLGRSPGEGNGYPLQYCGLKKSIGSQRAGHDCTSFTHTTALSGFSSVKADIQDVPTLCWIVDRQICSVHGSEAWVLDRSEMDTYRFC